MDVEKKIEVSVICNVYNHECYVRDALEGFVSQKTDFLFEVLVHDDASTDRSADVIREYENKYPELIKPIYQKENQYSKKVSITIEIQIPRAKGRFIAFCEGDDYWNDPLKLQKQFDAMNSHPEVNICATGALMSKNEKMIGRITPSKENCIFSFEQVLLGGGNFVASASLFFKKELNDSIPCFRKFFGIDYALQIHGAMHAGMLYLNSNSVVYRFQSASSWSRSVFKDLQKKRVHKQMVGRMLELLDKDTNHQYTNIIKEMLRKNDFDLCELSMNFREMKSSKYKDLYGKLSWKRKLKINAGIAFPGAFERLYKIYNSVK